MTTRLLLSVAVAALLIATPALAMNKAELIDAIASDANLSKADAKRALEGFLNSTSKSLKKGDKVALIGFGSFSISRGAITDPGDPTAMFGGKPLKPIKVQNRNGNRSAGTLSLGENGTWELVIGIPDADYYDETIELEMKMPKPIEPRLVELSLDLPTNSAGSDIGQILDGGTADGGGIVIEITLPSNAFDDFAFDETRPDPDLHAALYTSMHADPAGDFCADAVLADRLGFDGEPVCAAGTSCALDPATYDELVVSIAGSSGLDPAAIALVLDAIQALIYPPPSVDPTSVSGFGSFSIRNRAARKGRNPQTGKSIKITAKKVAKFKAGKALADTVK